MNAPITMPSFPVAPGEVDYDPAVHVREKQRKTLIAMFILVFGFGLAAAVVPIGGAVVGSGQVGVASHVKRISHPVGGVVAEIFVQNGQHVRKGQPLLRFDDRVSGADAAFSTLSVDQLLAQRARLEAERIGAPAITFPKELMRDDAGAKKAMADEQKMFALRHTEQTGLVAQLNARIGQYSEQIRAYNAQITAIRKQSALIGPELQGVKELLKKDLVTISRVNQLDRTQADFEGSIGALNANIAQTQARITEAREQIIQLGDTRRSEAGTQLAQINAALNQQQVRNVSAVDTKDRSILRAPTDGVIDKLAVTTIGGVVRPADVVMEIVPAEDRMVVEGAVSPTDIDQIQVGQRVRLRFSAFNSTATPEIGGTLTLVAADRSTDAEGKQSFFPVKVRIDEADLSKYPEMKLKPGMPAEVHIETGERTMLSYLTKPLRDQFARAFRDN